MSGVWAGSLTVALVEVWTLSVGLLSVAMAIVEATWEGIMLLPRTPSECSLWPATSSCRWSGWNALASHMIIGVRVFTLWLAHGMASVNGCRHTATRRPEFMVLSSLILAIVMPITI